MMSLEITTTTCFEPKWDYLKFRSSFSISAIETNSALLGFRATSFSLGFTDPELLEYPFSVVAFLTQTNV